MVDLLLSGTIIAISIEKIWAIKWLKDIISNGLTGITISNLTGLWIIH